MLGGQTMDRGGDDTFIQRRGPSQGGGEKKSLKSFKNETNESRRTSGKTDMSPSRCSNVQVLCRLVPLKSPPPPIRT